MELTRTTIHELFEVKSGDYHATKELDNGPVPLISCSDSDNGLIGYFDIPEGKRYVNNITVAYNGQQLNTKYHPYEFGAKDDVGVLLPRNKMSESQQLFIAAQLNIASWRYSYGRKCFKKKLENFEIFLPKEKSVLGNIHLSTNVSISEWRSLIPEPTQTEISSPKINWKLIKLADFFDLHRGDFHSITFLNKGPYYTVSRVTTNNGVVGKYERPIGAKLYKPGTITVSTLGGDAFVQLVEFMATDNVIVCVPKRPLSSESLYFVASMINQQKWRYSYGRQPYKTKLELMKVYLPIKAGNIDEDAVDQVINNSSFWPLVKKHILTMSK